MTRQFHSWLIGACLAFTIAFPLAAQFDAAAVVRYTAEEIDLGFRPAAMNSRGWIVGQARGFRPMRYRPGIGTELISNLHGWLGAINNAGTAVGMLEWHDGRSEAIIRPAGAPWKRITTLPDARPPDFYSINDAGQAVGDVYMRSGGTRPVIYTEAEGLKMLVDREGYAEHINELGQVALSLRVPGSPECARVLRAPIVSPLMALSLESVPRSDAEARTRASLQHFHSLTGCV